MNRLSQSAPITYIFLNVSAFLLELLQRLVLIMQALFVLICYSKSKIFLWWECMGFWANKNAVGLSRISFVKYCDLASFLYREKYRTPLCDWTTNYLEYNLVKKWCNNKPHYPKGTSYSFILLHEKMVWLCPISSVCVCVISCLCNSFVPC